ncbi:hypothetical protein BGX20_004565 [Mortierella sp. AD010]|nr:hypothetical protein BGX20_004565 [Mortierella sp. AD010]
MPGTENDGNNGQHQSNTTNDEANSKSTHPSQDGSITFENSSPQGGEYGGMSASNNGGPDEMDQGPGSYANIVQCDNASNNGTANGTIANGITADTTEGTESTFALRSRSLFLNNKEMSEMTQQHWNRESGGIQNQYFQALTEEDKGLPAALRWTFSRRGDRSQSSEDVQVENIDPSER